MVGVQGDSVSLPRAGSNPLSVETGAPAKANILWGGLLSRPFYSLAGNCLMIPSANPSAITII